MSAERDLDRLEELACDAALFGLSDEERRELEELGDDAAELVADLERTAGELAAHEALRRPATEPLPVDLETRLRASAPGASAAESRPPAAAEKRPPAATEKSGGAVVVALPRRGAPAWLGWAAAAAAALVAAGGWLRSPGVPPEPVARTSPPVAPPSATATVLASSAPAPTEDRKRLLALPGTTRTAWAPTKDAAASKASGDVVWHSGLQRGYMRFSGLEPNDPKKTQYQLWIFDAERDERYPVDGGVFDVGPDGEVVVPIDPKIAVKHAKLFAVTVEPPGGVVVSKRERIVLTAAPSG